MHSSAGAGSTHLRLSRPVPAGGGAKGGGGALLCARGLPAGQPVQPAGPGSGAGRWRPGAACGGGGGGWRGGRVRWAGLGRGSFSAWQGACASGSRQEHVSCMRACCAGVALLPLIRSDCGCKPANTAHLALYLDWWVLLLGGTAACLALPPRTAPALSSAGLYPAHSQQHGRPS